MLLFLKTAEYHTKTCFDVSDEFYSNLKKAIFGVLQGSGSAPTIWLAVSLVFIEIYKKIKFKGIPVQTSTNYLTKILDPLVDDTDLWDIILTTTTVQQLVSRLKCRAQ